MDAELETVAASIIAASPYVGVPIRTLHRALAARLGPDAGTETGLYDRLRRRSDLFHVFEPRRPPWTPGGIAPEAEPELAEVLHRAGIDLGPRVLLRAHGGEARAPAAAIARRVEETLTDLLEAAGPDGGLDGELLEAMDQLSCIGRRLAPAGG